MNLLCYSQILELFYKYLRLIVAFQRKSFQIFHIDIFLKEYINHNLH